MKKWIKDLGSLGLEAMRFSNALGGRHESSQRLLVVGTPEFEPWHFVAHLSEEAKRNGRADLVPTLARWRVPPGAPTHLSVSVDEIARATRHQTLLVVSSCFSSPELLERVTDAKKHGARIMAIHRDDEDLAHLSHEMLSVDARRSEHDFDLTQHLITDYAPMVERQQRSRWGRAAASV